MSRTCINSNEEAFSEFVPMQYKAQSVTQFNQNLASKILYRVHSHTFFFFFFEAITFPHKNFMHLKF